MQSVTRTPVLTDYVYLCHAPADHQFVLDLDEALKTRGVATFAPIADGRTTRGTGNRETARGPAEARALIFVLSPASTTSDECRRELEEASRNHIPVLVIERGSLEPALTPPEVTNLSSVLMQDGSDFFATIDNAIVPWVETVPDRQSRSARVFISYSRKNKEQVQELVRELKEQQVEVWVDWEDIPAGLPWRQEVADAILASDATLFLISRHSVVSAECGNEIQYALENNKRLITVKLDDVDDVAIPPPLREINYIPWFDGCDRAEGLRKLVYAARYDLLWVRQHTRWLQRAQEWQDRRRERPKAIGITAPPLLHLATSWAGTWRANRASKGSLLRGAVLFDAEDWLKHYTNHEPSPTDLQRLYIRTSRRAENYAHRMAIAAIGVAVIVVILAVAAAAITREAEINSMDQQAQQALVNLRNNPEASVGEAAGAVKTLQFLHADTSAATSALRQVLAGSHIRAVLRQDKGTLWSATMNPQGTLVATAGDDGKAFLWNWRTGKSIRLHARNLNEFTAAFSPDGRLVAVGGYLAHRFEKRQFYGLLQVFDTRTGKERMADETHSVHEIYQVAFSHDGRWLAAATLHGVWAQNVSRGGNFVYFLGQGSNDEMDTVQFSRDGRYVVTASADGAARVWRWSDPGHLAAIYRCAGKSDAMKQAVFSPDGKTVAVGCGSGAVALWHWQSGTFTTLRGQTSFINAVAFSPDGTRVLTGSGDGTARIWDARDGHVITLVRPDGSAIWAAAFSHDSNYIALGNEDDMASVWDARTGEQIAMLRGHSPAGVSGRGTARQGAQVQGTSVAIDTIEFSQDDQQIITGGDDGTARVWDSGVAHPLASWNGHSLAPLLNLHAQLETAAFSPDGTHLLVAGKNVWLYSTRTWQQLAEISGHKVHLYFGSAEFSPDGRYIVTEADVLNGIGSYAIVWAVHGSGFVRVSTSPKISGGLNISPTFIPTLPYDEIVMPAQDGHAVVWNWRTHKVLAILPGVTRGKTTLPLSRAIRVALSEASASVDSQMNDAQFSPNGTFIATSQGRSVEVWDWETGRSVAGPFPFDFAVENAIFSPNGQYLLAGSNADTAVGWHWRSGQSFPPLVGDSNEVYNVAFGPDGSTALTASSDGTARLWDWQDGVDLMQLRGATAAVYDAEYSPNSKLIVTASSDGGVRLYDCDICGSTHDLLRLAQLRQP